MTFTGNQRTNRQKKSPWKVKVTPKFIKAVRTHGKHLFAREQMDIENNEALLSIKSPVGTVPRENEDLLEKKRREAMERDKKSQPKK